MSSGVVRSSFRAALTGQFPTLPVFETLAVRVDNTALPELWAATDFVPISDLPISIGAPACRRELGTFRTYVVGRTGAGEFNVIWMADQIAAYFRNWRDAAKQIRVQSVIPPAPSEFSDGRWLLLAIDFAFAHDYYV
jgi:hypothetical protein